MTHTEETAIWQIRFEVGYSFLELEKKKKNEFRQNKNGSERAFEETMSNLYGTHITGRWNPASKK